jgi:hypothetical protein
MAAEQDDFAGGSFDGSGFLAGEPAAAVAAGGRQQNPAGPAFGASVWQQSVAAWQEAGIDWLREARPGPGPEERAAAEADLQHTEPIPVVPALDAPGEAGSHGPAAGPAADEDLIVLSAAEATAAGPGSGQAGAGAADGAAAAGAPADEVVAAEDLIVLAGHGPVATAAAPGTPARGEQAPGKPAAAAGTPEVPGATVAKTGRTGPSRRAVIVAAATAVVLVAGTIAGVAIVRSGGPAGPTFELVTPYPAAALADGDYPAQPAVAGLPPSLTAVAAAGKTIVAAGSQGGAPALLPLILYSQNGGRTWARAALGHSSVPPGPGAVPVLVARGRDTWLALGQGAAWTSANGQAWQGIPGPPTSAGDKILGLTRTHFGFVAVGENIPGPSGLPSPVLWTSANGRSWQRKSGAALTTGASGGLDAGGASMVSLRWAAYHGNVIIVGGEISRPVVEHRGKRRIIANVVSPALWRSRNNGATWQPDKLPASHGAGPGLAGLAATSSAFVAIRPGRTLGGRRDAVAFVSGTGTGWRYGGRLIAGRRAPLRVLTVAASQQAFVVSGTTPVSRIAFVSPQGRGWHKTADQGRSTSTTVTGVTVAPGPIVVAAGLRHRPGSRAAGASPYLLLTGTGTRRTLVGAAVLTAARTADVTVNSLAAAGGEQVAAGTTDGAPALWSAPANGHWAPSPVSLPASWHVGSLTSVVHGGAGWLATGLAGSPAQPGAPAQPGPAAPPSGTGPAAPPQGVVMTAAGGSTWRPAAGAQSLEAPGTTLAQAAAGPAGYVVVGSAAGPGGRLAAAAWYSAGLSTWSRATVAGTAGQMLAVTAGRAGFVAVGSAGTAPAVWTARTGLAWQPTALPLPAGTVSAVLTRVTAVGGRVVAVGDATRAAAGQAASPVPFAAVSGDGGRHWRETMLRAQAGSATVTALTAAGNGFVAAGLSGVPGNQAMLSWWSAGGLSWHGGAVVAGPVPGRGVQQLTALSAVGGVLTGAGYAVTQSGEHPIIWHARYH